MKDAMERIARSGTLMVCVIDENKMLSGILTDSDVRRALLSGAAISDDLDNWMTRDPVVGAEASTPSDLRALAHSCGVREIPLVNSRRRVRDVFVLGSREERISLGALPNGDLMARAPISSPLLILAGGKGMRLRSVVSDRPKPLAEVGGRPMIDTVLAQAARAGFKKVFVAVNFMADQIEEHLKKRVDCELDIEILREERELGTAGCLGMVRDTVSHSIVVTNADVLTRLPFERLVAAHMSNERHLTCVVREHVERVPYGVVRLTDGVVSGVDEKPALRFLVNTGIYAVHRRVLEMVEDNKYLDMPTLINLAISEGLCVKPFLSHEYWLDVGRPDDYHRANQEFESVFGKI